MFSTIVFLLLMVLLMVSSGAALHMAIFKGFSVETGFTKKVIGGFLSYLISRDGMAFHVQLYLSGVVKGVFMKRRSILILVVCAVVLCFAGITPAADPQGKINLNTATVDQLAKVPGLNQDLAKKLVDQRKKNGEFVDMEELLDVKGITKDTLRNLKKHLFIKPASGCNC